MKRIKKILSVLLVSMMLISFVACGNVGEQAETFNVGALKGPTGIGMVNLLDAEDKKVGDTEINYTVAGAPDEIVGKLLSGEIDAACLPGNMGATLYNKSKGKFQVASINTLGILYIAENTGVTSDEEAQNNKSKIAASEYMGELKGKTIYASGKGSMPEYVLSYLLEKNGLKEGEDVEVKYLSEHSAVLAKLASEKGAIAMLPEPFITTAEIQTKGIVTRKIDLTDVWEEKVPDIPLAMTVFVINKEYAEKYPGTVNQFMDVYKKSIENVNANVEEAAKLSVKHELLASEEIAKKAIPNCNIVFEKASDYKSGLDSLHKMLYDYNPKAVGGKLPNEDLYYEGY